jgi:DNA mismatch repair protein MutS
MSESSYILNNATENSLVLIDELGRGTATYDGLSLAWSIAQYLANKIKSYSLFATHYLELTELSQQHDNIKNYHVSAIDQGDHIVFTHFIEPGSANKSYGIHVAELAGINSEVIHNAKQKLETLENIPTTYKPDNTNSIENDLYNLDIMNLTPIEALQWLNEKQSQLKKGKK